MSSTQQKTNEKPPAKSLDLDSASDEPIALDDLGPLLQKLCERWQKRLRLSDWHVVVKLCRLNEMGRDCVGCIFVYNESKDAVMMVLSPLDLPLITEHFAQEESNYDLTIVHELLHLHFAPFQEDDTTPRGLAQEQAINCLSQALVSAYVKKPVPPPTPVGVPQTGYYL